MVERAPAASNSRQSSRSRVWPPDARSSPSRDRAAPAGARPRSRLVLGVAAPDLELADHAASWAVSFDMVRLAAVNSSAAAAFCCVT